MTNKIPNNIFEEEETVAYDYFSYFNVILCKVFIRKSKPGQSLKYCDHASIQIKSA